MFHKAKLFILLTFLVAGACLCQAATTSCEISLGAEPIDIDLEVEAQKLSDQVHQLDPKSKAQLDAQAEKLIAQFNLISNVDAAELDLKRTMYWFGYGLLTTIGYHYIMKIRDEGVVNVFTTHYSNSIWGLGLMGIADQFACFAYSTCKALTELSGSNSPGLNRLIKSVKARVQQSKFRNLDYRTVSMYATAMLFTIFNAGFELNGLVDGFSFYGDRNNVDWTDFAAGQAAVVAYIAIQKLIVRKAERSATVTNAEISEVNLPIGQTRQIPTF